MDLDAILAISRGGRSLEDLFAFVVEDDFIERDDTNNLTSLGLDELGRRDNSLIGAFDELRSCLGLVPSFLA